MLEKKEKGKKEPKIVESVRLVLSLGNSPKEVGFLQ